MPDGLYGDNRAGINGTLNRLSMLPGRSGKPMGVTLCVCWHVFSVRGILVEVLLAPSKHKASVLVLGPLRRAETSLLRHIARILSGKLQVISAD